MRPQADHRDTPTIVAKNYLLILALCLICIAAGVTARNVIEPQSSNTLGADIVSDNPEADYSGTIVVQVNAVLSLPTEAPTPTETPPPQGVPTREPALDFCGAKPPVEGEICRMPNPTATITPTLPACHSPEAVDGHLCQYRDLASATPHETNELVEEANDFDHDAVATDAALFDAAPTNAVIPTLEPEA
jgi:hypothetical protein